MADSAKFDELKFFADMKKRPGIYLGQKSLLSLRDQLFGMNYAFAACGQPDALKYFHGFIEHYHRQLFQHDQSGYVCWWNHMLYTSGNMDSQAFELFFREFESYLLKEYALKLPFLP